MRASVDRSRVPRNGHALLSVEINGAQHVPAPDVPVDGCVVRYVGPSTQFSVVNGIASSSVTHRYTLTPQRDGHMTVHPITVAVGGKTFQTDPIVLDVVPASAAAATEPHDADGAPTQELQLQLGVDKTRAYVNEAVPMRLQLLVGGVQIRGIELPPRIEADGFLVRPIGEPTQSPINVGGQEYTLVEFETTVVPIQAGELTLGPAALRAQVVAPRQSRRSSRFGGDPFESFFGDSFFEDFFDQMRVVPIEVTADPILIEALPFPEEGKPADFAGAVGQFVLEAEASPAEVAAGEPVTVTLRVGGSGNFDTVHPPKPEGDLRQFKVYDPQVRASDSRPDKKVFEQVLIPIDPSARETPAFRFSYFNPVTKQYETARQAPIPLTVKPAATPEPDVRVPSARPSTSARQPAEPMGRDLIYIKPALGAARPAGEVWYRSARWLIWLVGPFLLLLASEIARRIRQRVSDPTLARASGALKRALARCRAANTFAGARRMQDAYGELFRALQRYVGDRFGVRSDGMTVEELARVLRDRGADDAIVQELNRLAAQCDAARFAPVSVAADQFDSTRNHVETLLRRLEQLKGAR